MGDQIKWKSASTTTLNQTQEYTWVLFRLWDQFLDKTLISQYIFGAQVWTSPHCSVSNNKWSWRGEYMVGGDFLWKQLKVKVKKNVFFIVSHDMFSSLPLRITIAESLDRRLLSTPSFYALTLISRSTPPIWGPILWSLWTSGSRRSSCVYYSLF